MATGAVKLQLCQCTVLEQLQVTSTGVREQLARFGRHQNCLLGA